MKVPITLAPAAWPFDEIMIRRNQIQWLIDNVTGWAEKVEGRHGIFHTVMLEEEDAILFRLIFG